MAYWVIFCIIVFAAIAMMVREGLWSNTITLINIFISGIVAFGFYSAIVVYLDEDVTSGQHTYWLDFAILWALFAATMVICRSLTAACSKTRMRFKYPIDSVGGPLVGVIAAWVLACFTMATLHVAPMGKEAFGGKLVYDVDFRVAAYAAGCCLAAVFRDDVQTRGLRRARPISALAVSSKSTATAVRSSTKRQV